MAIDSATETKATNEASQRFVSEGVYGFLCRYRVIASMAIPLEGRSGGGSSSELPSVGRASIDDLARRVSHHVDCDGSCEHQYVVLARRDLHAVAIAQTEPVLRDLGNAAP